MIRFEFIPFSRSDRENMAEPAASPKIVAILKAADKPARRRRGRWWKRGFFLFLLVGIFGWFAPSIVATTELRNQLPKLLLPDFPGSLELGEASLNWNAPIVLRNVRLSDLDGQSLLDVRQFSTNETLWTLVTQRGNLGTVKFVEPVIRVSMNDNDSNLEQFLTKLIGERTHLGNRMPDVAIEIENGRVELSHPASNRNSTIDQISLRLVSTNGGMDEVDLVIGNPPASGGDAVATDWIAARYGGPIEGGKNEPAIVANQAALEDTTAIAPESPTNNDSASKSANTRHAVLRASHWKLDRLGPVVARFVPNAELGGELTANATIGLALTATGLDWDWNGTVTVQHLLVAGIAAMQRDRFALDQVTVAGRVATTQERLAMHDFKVMTDIAELTATGDISLDIRSNKPMNELVHSLLSDEDYHINGHVDLKKLAALLPQTLRIREGIEITSGDIRVQLVGAEVQGVRRWSGVSEIAGLHAIKQGQQISWDQPITARMNAHRDQKSIVIDFADCKSDFLQVAGKGTLDDASFTASGNLSNLLQNVEQFVDLGIDQLTGQMKARGEVRRHDDQHVESTATILLDDFAYVVSNNSVWREKHFELSLTGTALTDQTSKLVQIDKGEIHLNSGPDSFDLILQQPIDLTSSSPIYVAAAKLKGGLPSWQNRLRPFANLQNWNFVGTVNCEANLQADSQHLDVGQLTVGLQDLVAEGPGWLIKEPEVKLETAGKWQMSSQKWKSPKLALTGKSLTLQITDLDCKFDHNRLTGLSGAAAYRADLVQLSSWRNLAIESPSYYLVGSLTGTANVIQRDQQLAGELDVTVEKLVVAGQGTGTNGQPQWIALWKEPQLKVTGKCAYDKVVDALMLDSVQVDVDGLTMGAKGKLSECYANQRIDLTGDLAYDWDALSKRFGPTVGQNIQVSGKDRRSFSMTGSLAGRSRGSDSNRPTGIQAAPVSLGAVSDSAASNRPNISSESLVDISGQAGLGWTAANLYGITAGAGEISARMEQGVCRFLPLDVAVNDGRLHATPTIFFDRDPFMLELPTEKLIDRVSLSRELCRNSLKFIAPMLADSTEVEGKISVDVRGASLPLNAILSGTGDGVLSIHGAQAKPGALAEQLIGAINQVRSILKRQQVGDPKTDQVWLDLPEQEIPFKLEQGRIYHDGLTLIVSNVAVKTRGSVGVDESLNLIAEIAIKDEWLGDKLVAGLKGKSIQIPIIGTMSRPQIDPSIFESLAQQIGGSAIEGLLQDKIGDGLDGLINKGLDQLFKGKK